MSNLGRFDDCLYAVVSTVGGECGLLWCDSGKEIPQLLRVYPACPDRKLLQRAVQKEYSRARLFDGVLPKWLQPASRFLVAYYVGDKRKTKQLQPDWRWLKQYLFWQGQTDFTRNVLAATFKIKSGTTMSYGELARNINRPRAARAVGGALARNPWPVLIPCHRVIGSDGSMTGFSGHGAIATKKRMLAIEQ
jgi:O-6-methylguanine DNA methyltransferase